MKNNLMTACAVTCRIACVGLLLIGVAPADAQILASEPATMTQTVDGTEMVVNYSRPSLRGRTGIFGGQVHWGEVWTPGADWATTFEFSKDVTLNDHPVSAGKYSVWMIVWDGDWEVVLDPRDRLFHTDRPDSTEDQIRFWVTPETVDATMETLAFSFPVVKATGAQMRMHWENTVVDLAIGVEASRDLTFSADAAQPYLGKWAAKVNASPMGPENSYEFEISYADDHMWGVVELGPENERMDMVYGPAADQIFNPVIVINGEIAGVVEMIFLEFEMDDNGNAVSFVVRNPDDSLWMEGTRID